MAFAHSEVVSDSPAYPIDAQIEEGNHTSNLEDSTLNPELFEEIDIETYVPIVNEKKEWLLSETDLGMSLCL